jgi:hypothetical protein
MPSSRKPRRQRNALAGWFVAFVIAVILEHPNWRKGYRRMVLTVPGEAQRGEAVTKVT